MIIDLNVKYVNNLPVAIFDNFYNEEEYQRIFNELLFLNGPEKLLDPEFSGSAYDLDDNNNKIYRKKNKATFLEDVYHDRRYSDILNINRKLFNPNIIEKLEEIDLFFRYLKISNRDTTMISYYENNDYYKFHRDDAVLTALCWFYKIPKKYFGGDLELEQNVFIESICNRLILFPSIIEHKVTDVNMDPRFLNNNNGRFTMTQFIFMERSSEREN